MPNERITTSIILNLLSDDEIHIHSLRTCFYVLTNSGKTYNETTITITELLYQLVEGTIRTLWIKGYPREYEDDFGFPVEVLDDIIIFPQGIAHIEANPITVKL